MEFVESMKNWPRATKDYYNELKLEMKRVTWPSRKQVESTTLVVILTVFAFAAYFWIVDGVLTNAITQVYHLFTKGTLPR